MLLDKHEGLSLILRVHIKMYEGTHMIPQWEIRDRQVPGGSLASQPASLMGEARNMERLCLKTDLLTE